jgi:hypothetical protein
LRASPKLWADERDDEIERMNVAVAGKSSHFEKILSDSNVAYRECRRQE